MTTKQAVKYKMIDESLLQTDDGPQAPSAAHDQDNEGLFVSDDDDYYEIQSQVNAPITTPDETVSIVSEKPKSVFSFPGTSKGPPYGQPSTCTDPSINGEVDNTQTEAQVSRFQVFKNINLPCSGLMASSPEVNFRLIFWS